MFVAHTTEAWEFSEADFFKVTGSGGTVASTGSPRCARSCEAALRPGDCNVYLFYASDGDNAADDRAPADQDSRAREAGALRGLCGDLGGTRAAADETVALFEAVTDAGLPCGRFSVTGRDDIAVAVRHFFTAEAQAAAQPSRQASRHEAPTGAAMFPDSKTWPANSDSTGRR